MPKPENHYVVEIKKLLATMFGDDSLSGAELKDCLEEIDAEVDARLQALEE